MGSGLAKHLARIALINTKCVFMYFTRVSIEFSIVESLAYLFSFDNILLSGDVHPNPGPRAITEDKLSTFCHINVRSLLANKRLDDLLLFNTGKNFDILTLSETWLDGSITDDQLKLDGYNLIRKDRNRHGGGVAVFIRNDIHFKVCEEYSNDSYEVIWLHVYFGSKKVLFGTVYVPPESSSDQSLNFTQYLESVVDRNSQSLALPVIITGDFNAKSRQWFQDQSYNVMGSKLYDFVQNNNMVQLISDPTRITPTGSSLLDLIITDSPAKVKSYGVESPLYLCDHCPIWATFDFKETKKTFLKTFYDLDKTDIDALKTKLANSSWENIYTSNDAEINIDRWLENFYTIIKENTHCTVCKVRSTDKPWFRNKFKHLINTRHRLFKKAKLRNKVEDWSKYHESAKQCMDALSKAKEDHLNSLIESLSDYSTCSKKWWKVTKEIIGNKKDNCSVPPLSTETGEIITDPNEKCNLLNSHFYVHRPLLTELPWNRVKSGKLSQN